jgi:branched-chain amino acid transport system substrate-binding protein
MKKLLLITGISLLILVSVFAVACGSSTETTTTTAAATVTTAAVSTDTTAASTETTVASTETTVAATGEPIKIGHIVDLTGAEAMVGANFQKSLEYAVKAIGGQIAGRPIEIVIGDAQNQPSVAVDLARKMVEQDKVVAIFGPTQVGQKMAVANYLKGVGIPLILYNLSPLAIFQDNKWVVGVGGTTVQQQSAMGDYIYNQLKYTKIDTLSTDNTAGRSFLDPLTDAFKKAGGTVVQQQWAPVPTNDFASYLTALKDANALVAWNSGSDAIGLWTAYQQLGIKKKMPMVAAFNGGFTDPFIPKALSDEAAANMMGAYAPMMYSPDSQSQANLDFVKGFTPVLGFPPGDTSASGPYQSLLLFQAAVTATNGDTTPDKLLAAIFAAKIDGPEGPLSFEAGQQAATKNVNIVQIQAVPNVAKTFHYVTAFTYEAVPPTGYVSK